MGEGCWGVALPTGIPVRIHLVGLHLEIDRTLGTNLPFRLKWEDCLRFAAPMNLRFDTAGPWSFLRAGAFPSAIVALML
jgi:hypothetical protein